jgi:CHASE3 domain sensor protein
VFFYRERMTMGHKLIMVTCWINMVAVALMAWWAYGVNQNNESVIKQRVAQEFNLKAQEICNQCIQQFARQHGLKIMGMEE